MYTHVCVCIYIYIYIKGAARRETVDGHSRSAVTLAPRSRGCRLELRYSYPYPAKKISTNFRLYVFLLQKCYTNCLGHGHGYECHSPGLANRAPGAQTSDCQQEGLEGKSSARQAGRPSFWRKTKVV